jgi:hypothetical protein
MTAQLHMGQTTMIAQDSEVALLFYKGAADRDSLSGAERLRFDSMLSIQLQARSRPSRRPPSRGRISPSVCLARSGRIRALGIGDQILRGDG